MSDRATSQLPLPSETSHITRRRPSQPLPTTTQDSQQHIPQHTCNSPSCAAAKVLSTPELLESTLAYLPTKSILSLRHVSKTWHSLTTTSPSLRLHLFLEPQWNRPAIDFQLLPCTTISGLQIVRGEPVHLGQWIEVQMTPRAARSISRKIYKRPRPKKHRGAFAPSIPYEVEEVSGSDDENQQHQHPPSPSILTPQQTADLLLTQPPLVGVQASVVVASAQPHVGGDDDNDTPPLPLASSKLACDAGITLGFMAAAVNFLLRDLEFLGGPGDSLGRQDEEVVVVFRAIVSFCARTDGAPRMRGGTRFVTKVE